MDIFVKGPTMLGFRRDWMPSFDWYLTFMQFEIDFINVGPANDVAADTYDKTVVYDLTGQC